MSTNGARGLGGTHIITAPTAGKYARTRPPPEGTMTGTIGGMGPAKMTTSQMKAMGDVAITGTTEVSPIVEVLNMADYTHNIISVVAVGEPIFQASPSSITVRGFQPLETVQVQIALRNNDNVARRVKIVPPEGIYFSVELLSGKPSSKIAPGMDTHYVLKFTPEERIDYFCDLVCYTEREKFIIPVRALGPRGYLDLPDRVTFEKAPVKAETVKTLLVRNIGDATCTFTLSCTKPFRADPPTAALAVGQSMQIHLSFFPEDTEDIMGEVRLDYTTGESVIMYCSGRAEELAVRLDSQAMLMDPTYVSLFSQKTFKIINRSEDTLGFCFKQFASAAEEIKARMRFGAGMDESMEDDVEYDDSFRNDSFSISPMSGQVWPNAEVDCVVTFMPSTATEMACVAFCDVAGKQNRFPLHLQGSGIGPRIVLSYNVMDIGEVFINSVSEYDVELQNQGEIEAFFQLVPPTSLFGSKFQFEPSKGSLGVGQKESIKVSFSSDVLGEFNEDFGFALAGTPKPLTLSVRGKVIGPTFHLDETMLDYKRVSVAFLNSRHLHLFNTADIPFRFHLRVPGDGTLVKREFEVIPATGTILPHGKQKIQLDFIPLTPRNYNLQLVMDIESVGEQMASVEIRGTSIVPDVTISAHELDYGDCFLRYPYKKVIELVNHSDLPAKFELQPQDEISQCVAVYEVDYQKGTIEPFATRIITVSFTTMRLDKVQLPMFFTIIGHEDDPLEMQCKANGIGPRLTLTPPSIKWGDIEVLKDFEKTLKVKNDSLIPAEFQTLIMKRNSRFKVNMPSAQLAPGETANLKLLANIDDTQPFKDELCLIVTEGGEIKVPLLARGTGTTICCKDYDLGAQPHVKLGHQFTSRTSRKFFTITNRGPKPQTLSWYNGTALETLQKLKASAAEAEAAGGQKKKKDEGEIVVPETFHIEINGSKEPYILEEGASCTLEVIGFNKKAGSFTEKLCCKSKMEKEQRVIIEMTVSADFIEAVCEFSAPSLEFDYKFNPNETLDLKGYSKTATLRNVCALPLECHIKCSGLPFSVEPSDMDLQPGDIQTVHVHFDPMYRGDKMSENVKQAITVSYNMGPNALPKNERAPQGVHPKKATLELVGDINFPNVQFDKTEIKFGAVLNDTTRRIKVKCTNTSKIDSTFWWSFVVPDASEKTKRPTSSSTTTGTIARLDPPHPINAVFDILPIRSFLKPGESEDVEFVFYGHANHKYKATAVCEVQGGPEYEVKLDGEASSIQYKFDKTSIDFGNAFYDKFQMEEVTLINTGKVKFDFKVNSDSVAAPTIIKALPPTQVVNPGDKCKIQIQIYPGLPTLITTSFTIEVAHFEPQVIVVTGKGMFPHVAVNLPRVDPANYARLMQQAEGLLGFSEESGAETSRAEGMPGATQRTHQTEATEALRSGGGFADVPPTTAGTRRFGTSTAGGLRAPPMTMETFLATNPLIRQLQAEADCLGMHEYIAGQVADKEAEEEALRARVLFDEDKERNELTLDLDEPDEMLDAKSRPGTAQSRDATGPAVPPGPGAPESSPEAANAALSKSVFKTGLPFIEMDKYVLSEYVCDFGHVIKGQQLQKTFCVTNVGFSAISFEYPKGIKSALTTAGFVVEPDRVNRLPGAPDFETAEFSVLFNSGRPGVNMGPIDLLIPVAVRGGPQVNVYLKANVTIPDIELSSDNLKYGSVFCGHSRHVTVQLRNSKEIPATWSFQKALASEGQGAAKPCDDFTVIPEKGTLNPGETCNVELVFHPSTARTYTVKIPIRVNQNPTRRNVKISAQSENLGLRFDPPLLNLDPIMPLVVETEHKVTIHNDTDARIEFYSLDFNTQYLEEEHKLRSVQLYEAGMVGYSDVMLLPLRPPHSDLQADVLKAWAPIEAAEKAEQEATDQARIKSEEDAEAARLKAEEGGDTEDPPEEKEARTEAEQDGVQEAEGQGQPSRPPTTDVVDAGGTLQPLEPDVLTVMPINMLVYGHPLAAPRRIAQGLAHKYKMSVLNLEDMMTQLFKEAGIAQFLEEVPDEEAEEEDAPPKLVPVEGKWQLDANTAPLGAVKALQEIFFPPLPPPEAGEEGQPPAEEPLVEAEEDGEPKPEPGAVPPRVEDKEDGWMTGDFLCQLIKHKLMEMQFVRGVVVSGLKVSYMPQDVEVAKAVEMALSGKILQVIFPEYEEPPEAPEAAEGEETPAAATQEEPPAEEDEEKAHVGEEGEGVESREQDEGGEEEVTGKEAVEKQAVPFDPYGPEEEFDPELLPDILAKFDEGYQAIKDLFDPPPQEKGEEEEEPHAAEDEEAEKKEKLAPTIFKVLKVKRVGKQALEDLVLELMTALPEPGPVPGEARQLKIAPVFDREIVVRPFMRPERRRVNNFYILTPTLVPEKEGEEGEEAPAEDGEEAAPKEPQYTYDTEKSRWVVEAKSSIDLVIKFKASDTGRFESLLAFEVMGGGVVMRGREFNLPCRGTCAYPQMSQNYQSIYYRKIKAKAEGQIVSKQYIVNKNEYEFGPLLVGRSKDDYKEKYMESKDTFRITNSGLFDMHVDFNFLNDEEGKVFVVEPEQLDLPVDETAEVTVYAFPEEEGTFSDKLICNIKNNPEPVEISMMCIGNVPKIITDIEPPLDEEGNPVEGEQLAVEFQRLLLKRKDTRIVTIKNTSMLPTKWNLKGCSEEEEFNCDKEFSISPTKGMLMPGQTEEITIGFRAIEKNQFEKEVVLEWIDVNDLLLEPMRLPVKITAEAYEIDFTFTFPEGDGVDFGVLKVEEGGEQSFTIANNGLYRVGYKFAFARPKRSLVAKYFCIENDPDTDDPDYKEDDPHGKSFGELEPGSEANIKIVFSSKDFAGDEEVKIQDNMELKCYVSELLTGEEIFGNPIKLNVSSVFSKFRVLPQKGISFGALVYDTQKSRTFDIINQGEFEFEYKIECISGRIGSRPGTAAARKEVADPDFKGEDVDGGIKIGQFVVKPASGTVVPVKHGGQKETITVEFSAEGQNSFYEVLGVQISQRDPRSDVPDQGMHYEISGESCIPGILNTDFLQIFEEAAVSRKAPSDPNEIIKNMFIEEERTLYFGPRLVNSRSEMRVKIVNPTKVPITVKVDIAAKGTEPNAFEVLEPKELQIPMHEHRYATILFEPTGLQTFIASFEATVELGELEPKTNSLIFEVRGDGTLPRVSILEPTQRNEKGQALLGFKRLLKGKTQTQQIMIKNEGILPANVRFGRLAPWPSSEEAEEGTPVNGHESFSFTGRGGELLLQAKEEKVYDVTFMPKEIGKLRAGISMVVANNEFESNIIEIAGEGFMQDVSIGNLPEGSEDTLIFGNLTVGVVKQLSFSISNNSTKVYRFKWLKEEEDSFITFSPQEGHLQPGQSKDVMATVVAKKELDFEAGKPLMLHTTEIFYPEDGADWDDSIRDVEWVVDGDEVGMETSLDQSLSPESPKRLGKKRPKKVIKHRPEPKWEPVKDGDPPEEGEEDERASKEEEVDMKVSFTADYIKYAYIAKNEEGEVVELPALPPFLFSETMMYRERVHKFKFKNTSKSSIEYAWRVCFPDGQEDMEAENPFSIEPSDGKLQPNETVHIAVKFAPTEVDTFERKIICDIPNLDTRIVKTPRPAPEEGEKEPLAEEEGEAIPEAQQQPVLEITGKSARPLCHLELEESDWLSGGRRPPTLTTPGGKPVDPSSRCMEFESLGTQVRNTRRFFVMNPTNISYKYRWECDDGTGAAVAHLAHAFKCVHKEGFVLSGKKSEMVFEYTPDSDQLLESFWRFVIPEHDISVPFILVGHVKEPRVFFDQTYCNYNSLLIDHKGVQSVKLVNREHIPFAFNFDGKTYGADADPSVVKITPSSGTVAPEGEQIISVEFTPRLEKNYNYNAVCLVKKKATRLALNIKGEGFDNHASITMEDERGSVQVQPGGPTAIDFGEVHLNEMRQKTITVTNKGKYPIEYDWQTVKNRLLTIKPPRGIVQKGEKQEVKLFFHPMSEQQMNDHPVELKVINGPKFNFNVSARGRRPQLNFSFMKMDFGPCFLYRQGAAPTIAVLRLTNEDTQDISYDAQFDNKPYLEIDAPPTNLSPGQSVEIKITFMPRDLKEYSEVIPFQINGLITVNVDVTGSGHECDVTLANPGQFNYSLGAVKVGAVIERRIKVKNNSPVMADCNIAASVARLAGLDINIRPTEFVLRPRETTELELVYSPQGRMLPFTEDVKVKIAGMEKTLMIVNGSAVGVELKLETDMLFFGAVVANSRAVRKVQLENVGDIGTKWRWAAEAFMPDFSVDPAEGFLNPHDEVTLEFTFQPEHVDDDCRRDNIPLYIDGADPLLMTTTGICVSQQPQEESIAFNTPVRKAQTQETPPITNPTDQPWRLVPVVDNKYWSVPEILEIPPGQSMGCTLTYTPHAMTSHTDPEPEEPAEGQEPAPPSSRPRQHTGSVFIPRPDGTAVLYNLTGTAGPPEQEGEAIERDVQCKASHMEPLPVRNWLNRPQRFIVKLEPEPEGTTSVKGATYIDVPANAERTYALRFHTYVEGQTPVKVTLTNQETGEYLFYDAVFTAIAPPVLRSFELNTVVRQGKVLEIDLANPLKQAVIIKATCDNTDIVLEPEYELRASGETPCKLTYRPLLPSDGPTVTNVTFSSPELGDFVYQLKLQSSAAGADRSMQFKSAIGLAQTLTFRFLNFLPADCAYECSCDNAMFSVPASVSAAPATPPEGTEVEVEVTFDPDVIGECNAKLLVTSETGGSYTCILNGHGLAPRPQGPFEVQGSYTIDFKNPFSDAKSFTVAVDNVAFSTVESLPDVPGRSSAPISVSYAGGAGAVQAKLTVVCEGFPPWLYYLKGA